MEIEKKIIEEVVIAATIALITFSFLYLGLRSKLQKKPLKEKIGFKLRKKTGRVYVGVDLTVPPGLVIKDKLENLGMEITETSTVSTYTVFGYIRAGKAEEIARLPQVISIFLIPKGAIQGKYGLRIIKWTTKGKEAVFSPEENITFILRVKDLKDGFPADGVSWKVLGAIGSRAKILGKVGDGEGLGKLKFTLRAPSKEISYYPYARVCYNYKTETSQEFSIISWKKSSEERLNFRSGMNKAPVKVEVNPSFASYKGEVRPIQVANKTKRKMGIGIINRGEGFVANGTKKANFGEKGVLESFLLEVPYFSGNVTLKDWSDFNISGVNCKASDKCGCSKVDKDSDGKIDVWQCKITNLKLKGKSTALYPSFIYKIGKGEERKGRVRAKADYRYCLTTPGTKVKIRRD